MLKWLKQKPLESTVENITTDDPLAIIQVSPTPNNMYHISPNAHKKKLTKTMMSGSSGEIYAVSRVNPLFKEEGSATVVVGPGGLSPGNQSGSSGYDSSTSPSEDDSLNRKLYDYVPTNQLFATTDDVIIHQQASTSKSSPDSNGTPILKILTQNLNYVKNISLTNRPLSPIEESIGIAAARHASAVNSGASGFATAVGRKLINYMPAAQGPPHPQMVSKIGDSLGAAKLISRNKNYVQSIRIGPGPRQSQQPIGRKQSVTFAEKVDFVGSNRKISREDDSIVTESLLLFTSGSSGSTELGHHVGRNNRPGSSEDEDEGVEENYGGSERSTSDDACSSKSQTPRARSISSNSSKSAFGGIADHYAAAKEIAKEIESYSRGSGSGKSSGMGIVRDLLTSRGRSTHSASTSSSSFSFKKDKDKDKDGGRFKSGTLVSTVVQVQLSPGEVGRFPRNSHPRDRDDKRGPQVYVKAMVTNGMTKTGHSMERDEEDEGQDQVPIYEILPGGSSRLSHEDSDSGNSTDRRFGKEDDSNSSEGETHFEVQTTTQGPGPSKSQPPSKSSGSGSENSCPPSSVPNNDKVMIITGDSDNMVVDLSAVPAELRDAIVSGTGLITFPDGLRQLVDPGYTLITIPDGEGGHWRDDYGTKNKAQYWESLQNGGSAAGMSGGEDGKGGRRDKKFIGLPYHPNHENHVTPDFTLDGQRLAIQTRKVKNGKKRRCVCRICGMIFFLAAFLGVIVTLSLVYTNGRKYFGSA